MSNVTELSPPTSPKACTNTRRQRPSRDEIAERLEAQREILYRAGGIAHLIVTSSNQLTNGELQAIARGDASPAHANAIATAIWHGALQLEQMIDEVAGELEAGAVFDAEGGAA